MNTLEKAIESILNSYTSQTIGTAQVVSVLIVVLALALYEFVVYRVVLVMEIRKYILHILI